MSAADERGGDAPMQLWAYVPPYDVAAAFASAEANRRLLSGISIVRYRPREDGYLVPYPDLPRVPDAVRRSGIALSLLIANEVDGRWDRDVVASILDNPARRHYHVQHLLDRAVQEEYGSIEIDYEGLAAADREPFSAFVEELAAVLHRRHRRLAVAVHPKTSDPGEGGAAAQDYARIGAAAGRVAVMTYDHDPSRPGPIAPLQWTGEVLRFALTRIPADKLLQGIPLYGYHWAGDAAPTYLTRQQFVELARERGLEPRREPTDRHLVLEYTEGGVSHTAWLPDGETAAALASVGRKLGVAGHAVWRLGGEEPGALAGLAQSLGTS